MNSCPRSESICPFVQNKKTAHALPAQSGFLTLFEQYSNNTLPSKNPFNKNKINPHKINARGLLGQGI
jgi:hypothetical protein